VIVCHCGDVRRRSYSLLLRILESVYLVLDHGRIGFLLRRARAKMEKGRKRRRGCALFGTIMGNLDTDRDSPDLRKLLWEDFSVVFLSPV
jgi:hypothetical protein